MKKSSIEKNNVSICVIKWDQKKGGIIEAIWPDINISERTSMNIYNMHRVKSTLPSFGFLRMKLENGEEFNVCSFFSGLGSTHTDGFTFDYSKNAIGVAERVVCLFLPQNINSEEYELVLSKIASRILLSPSLINSFVRKLSEKMSDFNISNSNELLESLEKNIDKILGLDFENAIVASNLELKILHILIKEKNNIIKELTLNPVKSALVRDQQKLAAAEEQKKEIQELIKQITEISFQKDMLEMKQSEKDLIIEQLKADYVKIFGTLTDQINLLDAEIAGITESTQALINDLNQVLAEN